VKTTYDPNKHSSETGGLYYFEITRPQKIIPIDLSPLEPSDQKRIQNLLCQGNAVYFDLPGVTESTSEGGVKAHKPQRRLYRLEIGRPPEIIAEMRMGAAFTAIGVKGRYVIGSNRIVDKGVTEGHDNCALNYIRPDYKVLCWDFWLERNWPLSNLVLSEYRWEDTIQVRGEDGKPKYVPNQEKPIVGQGQQFVRTFFLRDLQNNIIQEIKLKTPSYNIAYMQFAISPDEQYLYSTCFKVGDHDPKYSNYGRVCRIKINDRQSNWQEVFSFPDVEHTQGLQLQQLVISSRGDVYFTNSASRGNTTGIWKYNASRGTVERLTKPYDYYPDALPKVSPSGQQVVFVRPSGRDQTFHNTLFILQPENQGASK
jgi:hypothetical protein